MSMPSPDPDRLLTTEEAAQLLNVDRRTILNWIKGDRIPYVKLPGGERRAQYRVPRLALLSMLGGNYDLAKQFRKEAAAAAEAAAPVAR
jgi:excisionase family DNA binding protein